MFGVRGAAKVHDDSKVTFEHCMFKCVPDKNDESKDIIMHISGISVPAFADLLILLLPLVFDFVFILVLF